MTSLDRVRGMARSSCYVDQDAQGGLMLTAQQIQRIYTSDGFHHGSRDVGAHPANTLFDRRPSASCGGQEDAESCNGRFFHAV
jgi:hypothetical protein